MKVRSFFSIFSVFIFLSLPLFSELSRPAENLSSEKKFVKGSISEKITILQSLKDDEIVPVGKKGLDFAIENASVLGDDIELARLAAASVRVFPNSNEEIKSKKIDSSKLKDIAEKFMTIFRLYKNSDVRSAVMERLEFYSAGENTMLVAFINDYLTYAYKTAEKSSTELESLISTIGKIGNEESLTVVYNIWASKIWPEYKAAADEALVSLSKDSFSDVIKIFSISKIGDFRDFFLLFKNSSKISPNFLCDVAENALLIAINNAEKLKENSDSAKKDFASFQVEAGEVLAENKWSHSANVMNENILLAKKAYEKGEMTQSDFVKLIQLSPKVPSNALAKTLTEFLSECNGRVEKLSADNKSEMPARSVVLALIIALGELGDKTAFDTLLYTSYLSYPVEVTDEAKKSLAKLNW
ncbi:MAG: hypothetical protein II821_08205 [Treponema sp.]|nr:hypothetical protein [Treponema sp.]